MRQILEIKNQEYFITFDGFHKDHNKWVKKGHLKHFTLREVSSATPTRRLFRGIRSATTWA